MSIPGWEGGGWVTLHINPTYIYGQLEQLAIKSQNNDFLAALSSSRSVNVGPLVGRSVGPSESFVKK